MRRLVIPTVLAFLLPSLGCVNASTPPDRRSADEKEEAWRRYAICLDRQTKRYDDGRSDVASIAPLIADACEAGLVEAAGVRPANPVQRRMVTEKARRDGAAFVLSRRTEATS